MPDLDDLMSAIVSGNLSEVSSILDAPGASAAIFEGQVDILSMACLHAGVHEDLSIEREGIVHALLRAGAPNLAKLSAGATSEMSGDGKSDESLPGRRRKSWRERPYERR